MTDVYMKAGAVKESTDMILTSMRHGIIDPDCSLRELLKNYADRLEIAIRREVKAARLGDMNGQKA